MDSNKMNYANKHLVPLLNAKPAEELPALAASLVHEIKNPLAAIHMHLQLLQNYSEEVQEAELRKKLQTKITVIQNEISNLNQTLHSFFPSLQPAPSSNEVPQALDLPQLLQQIINLLKPQAERENILLELSYPKIATLKGYDSSFIRQIVLNLTLNAIQAFRVSGTTHSQSRIQLFCGERKDIASKNSMIFIEVRDNGPGISKEVQEKMFDAFYTTREQKDSGGLGLTLVQHMVGSMGGRLEVESETGKGSAFIILLHKEAPPPKAQATYLPTK